MAQWGYIPIIRTLVNCSYLPVYWFLLYFSSCPKEDTQPSSPRAQPDLSLVDHNSLSGRHYQGSGEDKRGRGGRQESRRRGAGSMQYDLRTKLDSKAASARTEERRRYVNHSDDWSDVRERGSRKRGGLFMIIVVPICCACLLTFLLLTM